MKFSELPDVVKADLYLRAQERDPNLSLEQVKAKLSQREVPQALLDRISSEYPEGTLKPTQIMDPETGVMRDSTAPPIQTTDFAGRDLNETRKVNTRGVAPKGLTPEEQKLMDELTAPQSGGVYVYDIKGPAGNVSFSRKEPLAPADLKSIQEALDRTMSTKATISEQPSIRQNASMRELFEEAKRRKIFEPGTKFEDVEILLSNQPSMIKRKLIQGSEEPTIGSRLGDFAASVGDASSNIPRLAKGLIMGDDWEEAKEIQALQAPKEGSGFLSSVGQDIANDPFTLPTLATGWGMASSLARSGRPMAAIAKEGLVGGLEALGSAAYQDLSGQRNLSGADYLQEGALGAGLASGLGAASKKLTGRTGSVMTKDSDLRRKLRDFREDFYRGASFEGAANDLKVKSMMRSEDPTKLWDIDELEFLSNELGIPVKDLYPGLGMTNRSSDISKKITSLANESHPFYKQWEASYEGVTDALDRQLGFKSAMSAEEAGAKAIQDAQMAKAKVFEDNSTTYKNIVQDPEIAEGIGAQIQQRQPELLAQVDEMLKDIDNRLVVSTKLVDKPSTTSLDPLTMSPTTKSGGQELQDEIHQTSADQLKQMNQAKASLIELRGFLQNAQTTDPIQLARSLNNARSQAQTQLADMPLFERPTEAVAVQNKIRDFGRDTFMSALENVDKAAYDRLVQTNKSLSNFLKAEEIVGPVLEKGKKVSGAKVFSGITNDMQRMKAFRDMVGGLGEKNFNEYMKSFANQDIIRYATTGDLSDKQAILLKPNSKADAYFKEFMSGVDIDKTKRLAKALYTLSSPNRQGLGADMASLTQDPNWVAAIKSPTGFLKYMRDNASSKDTRKAKQLGRDIFATRTAALRGTPLDPSQNPSKAYQLGEVVGLKGLGALATLGRAQATESARKGMGLNEPQPTPSNEQPINYFKSRYQGR